MSPEFATELVGAAATATILSGYLIRSPKVTMRFTFAGMFMWLAYSSLFQAWALVAGGIAGLIRAGSGAFLPARLLPWTTMACVLIILASAFAPETPYAWFGIVSALIKTGAVFLRERVYLFRSCMISAELLQLPYAIAIGAMAMTVSTIIALGIMTSTTLWFAWQDRKKLPSSQAV
jgi:hypothetical protein